MKKKHLSERDAISVYQFMSMCGLDVEYRGNVLLSHEAMMRKLQFRKGTVIIPHRVSFKYLSDQENINSGRMILVRDDYNKVLVYRRPIGFGPTWNDPKTEAEREKRRQELIQEYEDTLNHEPEIKPGYQKYLKRKARKNGN